MWWFLTLTVVSPTGGVAIDHIEVPDRKTCMETAAVYSAEFRRNMAKPWADRNPVPVVSATCTPKRID